MTSTFLGGIKNPPYPMLSCHLSATPRMRNRCDELFRIETLYTGSLMIYLFSSDALFMFMPDMTFEMYLKLGTCLKFQ